MRYLVTIVVLLLIGCSNSDETAPTVITVETERLVEVPQVVTVAVVEVEKQLITRVVAAEVAEAELMIIETPKPIPAQLNDIIFYQGQPITVSVNILIDPVSRRIVELVTPHSAPQSIATSSGPTSTPQPDSLICDDIARGAGARGDRCLTWGKFEIDHRCYSSEEVTEILIDADWPADLRADARRIVSAESNGCANAIEEGACGLFQIAWLGHTTTGWQSPPEHTTFADKNCYNAVVNAQLALEIVQTDGWGHWSTAGILTPKSATISAERPTPTPTPAPTTHAVTETPFPASTAATHSNSYAYYTIGSTYTNDAQPTQRTWGFLLTVRVPTETDASFVFPFLQSDALTEENVGGDDIWTLTTAGIDCSQNYSHPLQVFDNQLKMPVFRDRDNASGNVIVASPCNN